AAKLRAKRQNLDRQSDFSNVTLHASCGDSRGFVRLSSVYLWLVAVLLVPVPAWGESIDVTCGDTVSYRHGRLVGDCTGSITLVSARLDLDGHTISGTGLAAVQCIGGCKISGPGAIVSAGSIFGVSGDDRIRVTEVTISGHDSTGVNSGN